MYKLTQIRIHTATDTDTLAERPSWRQKEYTFASAQLCNNDDLLSGLTSQPTNLLTQLRDAPPSVGPIKGECFPHPTCLLMETDFQESVNQRRSRNENKYLMLVLAFFQHTLRYISVCLCISRKDSDVFG